MEYKVVTEGAEHEVWGAGFYGEQGKAKAQRRIEEGYFHKFMYPGDKQKKIETIIDILTTTNSQGEVVKIEYVAEHEFMGQQIKATHIETTVARGIYNLETN